jgi:hypothetical protein
LRSNAPVAAEAFRGVGTTARALQTLRRVLGAETKGYKRVPVCRLARLALLGSALPGFSSSGTGSSLP